MLSTLSVYKRFAFVNTLTIDAGNHVPFTTF